MAEQTYNGWKNYETWVANLWLTNDEGSDAYWREVTQECYDNAEGDKEAAAVELEDMLMQYVEEFKPNITGMYEDMLNAAIGRVYWWEIADSMLDEIEEQEEDETDEE